MDLQQLKLTEKRKFICEKLNLNDSNDILSYYPFRYDKYEKTPYEFFKEGETVVFEAELISYPSTFRYGKRSTTRFKVLCEDEELLVTIFNRPWAKNLNLNEKMTIFGRYDGNNKVTATNYFTKDVDEVTGIIPTYSTKDGISQNEIKKLISLVYEKTKDELIDLLPRFLKEKHHLLDYQTSIYNIHFPSTDELLKQSLSRLKYEEFLRFYIALNILKGENNELKVRKVFSTDMVINLINSFGFELSEDQVKCKNDILNDLASERIMYRLLQGEVGSGKTAIAVIALYANALAGYQGALLAPTEILAKQHYSTLNEKLMPLGIKTCVLYSGMPDIKNVKNDIKAGKYDIVVGTHALFSEDVEYCNLGLVIADEQHRFGVNQRKALKNKGKNCDFLLMSATPIPRTLASSIYGDMDISTIETLPTGRKGCDTYLIKKNSIVDILPEIKHKLSLGRQVYIIAAAIERNENYKAKDVTGLYNSLIDVFKPYKVGLMHGKLDTDSKDQIMSKFNQNEIQVLICTTVVEVGVNVKNATMMIVYDADKFGLSQLHQLRGRVQRSSDKGTCYLLSESKDSESLKRLEVLTKTNDGFKISYEDLKLRGPGDILGTRQSGLPAFILGNLIEDGKFIEAAKKDAKYICENLTDFENKNYYEQILKVASRNYQD